MGKKKIEITMQEQPTDTITKLFADYEGQIMTEYDIKYLKSMVKLSYEMGVTTGELNALKRMDEKVRVRA